MFLVFSPLTKIKAIFPIGLEVTEKMVKYIKQEIAKDDFDGLDAKDVRM